VPCENDLLCGDFSDNRAAIEMFRCCGTKAEITHPIMDESGSWVDVTYETSFMSFTHSVNGAASGVWHQLPRVLGSGEGIGSAVGLSSPPSGATCTVHLKKLFANGQATDEWAIAGEFGAWEKSDFTLPSGATDEEAYAHFLLNSGEVVCGSIQRRSSGDPGRSWKGSQDSDCTYYPPAPVVEEYSIRRGLLSMNLITNSSPRNHRLKNFDHPDWGLEDDNLHDWMRGWQAYIVGANLVASCPGPNNTTGWSNAYHVAIEYIPDQYIGSPAPGDQPGINTNTIHSNCFNQFDSDSDCLRQCLTESIFGSMNYGVPLGPRSSCISSAHYCFDAPDLCNGQFGECNTGCGCYVLWDYSIDRRCTGSCREIAESLVCEGANCSCIPEALEACWKTAIGSTPPCSGFMS